MGSISQTAEVGDGQTVNQAVADLAGQKEFFDYQHIEAGEQAFIDWLSRLEEWIAENLPPTKRDGLAAWSDGVYRTIRRRHKGLVPIFESWLSGVWKKPPQKAKARHVPVGEKRTAANVATVASPEGRTDLANARRLVARFKDDLRWCNPWGSWLVWDGKRWRQDDTRAVERMAKDVVDGLWREARQARLPEALSFAAKSASAAHLKAMIDLAKSEPGVPVLPGELDSNSWLLNCTNGTIDLRTGDFQQNSRRDLITKLCPTAYEPEAAAPNWERFASQVFDGNAEIIRFVQRWCGYCCTGDVSEQLLPIWYGTGSNGKSTFLNAFIAVLGEDYAMQGAPDMLVEKRNEGHSTERMDLFGRRFVSCVETEDGHKLKESFVKMLTGGEKIRGRRCYQDAWEFRPTHKIVLCTNHKPNVRGNGHAIWRRLALVPFNVRFWNPDKGETGPPELKQDKELPHTLTAESEGILAWAIRGCAEWKWSGLDVPPVIRQATEGYKGEQDIIGTFIAECCTIGPHRVRFSRLYKGLEDWCDENGHNLPSRKFVGNYLAVNGYIPTGSKIRYYEGIGLIETFSGDDGDDATIF